MLVWTQVGTALGDFVILRLIQSCALGPLEASVLGSKTSSPYGKVGLHALPLGSLDWACPKADPTSPFEDRRVVYVHTYIHTYPVSLMTA